MTASTNEPIRNNVGTTAVHMAKLGYFVGPLKPGTKNPGSRLGGKWQQQTSNDPVVVARFFKNNPNDGLFLHVGKSGLIAFDLDTPSLSDLPVEVVTALGTGIFQSSRRKTDRGHYLFRTSEHFGNSRGGFVWGDVRGTNGVIVLAPTIHPDTREPYELVRGSWEAVPELPVTLRALIRVGGEFQKAPLDREELKSFLNKYVANTNRPEIDKRCRDYLTRVANGEARHTAMTAVAVRTAQEARRGLYSAMDAFKALNKVWKSSFDTAIAGRRTSHSRSEFRQIIRWSAAQPSAEEAADSLFDQSEQLRMVRRWAQEYSVGAFGLLAVGLARALVCLPPSDVLPPIVGSVAPPNLFVALVGEPGTGKDATWQVGKSVFEFPSTVESDLYIGRPGSSEGIAKMFGHIRVSKEGKKTIRTQEFTHTRVLAHLSEVDTLKALMGRDENKISATLRDAWTGAALGNDYSGVEAKFLVGDWRYRFCFVVGAQPGRAQTITNGSDGGLPQRFLWAPVTVDPRSYLAPSGNKDDLKAIQLPEASGDSEASALAWRKFMAKDTALDEVRLLNVPESVQAQVRAARALNVQAQANHGEGHRLLMQEKVAIALAIIHGKTDGFTMQHWRMADLVLRVSENTFTSIQRKSAEMRKSARLRGAEEAGQLRHRRTASEERETRKALQVRILEMITNDSRDLVPKSHLVRQISSSQREFFPGVLAELVQAKRVGLKKTKGNNGQLNIFCFLNEE